MYRLENFIPIYYFTVYWATQIAMSDLRTIGMQLWKGKTKIVLWKHDIYILFVNNNN